MIGVSGNLSREAILGGVPAFSSDKERENYLCEALIAQERWRIRERILREIHAGEMAPEMQEFALSIASTEVRTRYYDCLANNELDSGRAALSGYKEQNKILREITRKFAKSRLGEKFEELEGRLDIKDEEKQKFKSADEGVNYLADAIVSLRNWDLKSFYLQNANIDSKPNLTAQLEAQDEWLRKRCEQREGYYSDLAALREHKVKEFGGQVIRDWLTPAAIRLAKDYCDREKIEIPNFEETLLDIKFSSEAGDNKKPDDTREISEQGPNKSEIAEVEFTDIEDK